MRGKKAQLILTAHLIAGQLLCVLGIALSAKIQIRPTALASLRSGELVILDSTRGIFFLTPRSGEIRNLVDGFGVFQAPDIVSTFQDGGEALFVTMNVRSLRTRNIPQLVRFGLDGKRTGEWILVNDLARFNGLVIDAEKKVAYISNMQPPEIYRADLRRPRSLLTRLAGVRGAQTLGPMIMDARRGRLLISDPYSGRVYAHDLAKGRNEVLLEKVGEASALVLDSKKDRLFIADAIGERILVASLADPAKVPKVFSQLDGLDEPRGLVLGADGGLWVVDEDEGKLFLLDGDTGTLLRTLDLNAALLRKVPKR